MNKPATPPSFPKLDPASPAFWNARFQAGFTPWERGRVPNDFAAFIKQRVPLRTLIPGCGSAHEVRCLIECGWDITAIDFSPAAVTRAQDLLVTSGLPKDSIVEADFFDSRWSAQPFEFVYESAFLCALPRTWRSRWARQMEAVTQAGGLLAGYFFICEDKIGPPFGISDGELDALLAPMFNRIESRVPDDSIRVFEGKEQWMVWQKR